MAHMEKTLPFSRAWDIGVLAIGGQAMLTILKAFFIFSFTHSLKASSAHTGTNTGAIT